MTETIKSGEIVRHKVEPFKRSKNFQMVKVGLNKEFTTNRVDYSKSPLYFYNEKMFTRI